MAVALDLVAQRADHLAVAEIAALADVDVAAGKLERRVGPHALHLLDRRADSQNSGAISTRPPMATVMRMPIRRRIEFFSRT